MRRRWMAGALFAGLLLSAALAAPAAATSGEFTHVSAAPNGKVRVSAEATVWACENEWTFEEEAAGLPPGPCGGRLAVIATPPTLNRHNGMVWPGGCRTNLFGTKELWNREGVYEWVRQVQEWGSLAENPPEQVVWSRPLVARGEQPRVKARFKTHFGLWLDGMVDTPCVYLAYIYPASGSSPEEGCLDGADNSIREEFCSEEHWRDVWVWTLARAEIPTPYPDCEPAQQANDKVIDRWYRLMRKTYGKPKAWRRTEQRRRSLLREIKRSLGRIERSCPRIGI